MPSLSERLTAYGLTSGGMGVVPAAVLPDWWLSSATLLTIACICLVLSIALEETK